MKVRFVEGETPALPPAQTLTTMRPPLPGWSANPAAEAAPASAKVDWTGYWRSVVKRRWRVLSFTLLATIAAAFYAQSIQPVFRSTTTLLIESGKTKIVSIEEVYNAVSQDREYYQTQVEILRSHDVALRAVIGAKLWDEPEFDPRRPVRSLQGRFKDFVDPPPPLPAWTPELLANATVSKFLQAVNIEPVRLSQLVKISFDAHNPKLAAKMADATAYSFNDADRDTRLKLNMSVNSLLQDRLVALREKLVQSEDELQKFRERSGLVAMSGSQGIAGQRMAEISQRLVAASVRRTELDSAYSQVEGISDGNFSSLPSVIQQPGLSEARSRSSRAALALEEVTRTLGDQHTRVLEARSALAAAQKDVQAQTQAAVSALRRERAAARDTERSLQGALEAARAAMQGVNRQEFQLGVLEREVQTNKQLFELLLNRTKETGVSSNLQSAPARIVDSARPATAPLSPNRPQIVLATLLLSLLAAAAVCIAIDRYSNTLQGTHEAEQRLQHPVLATLPAIGAAEANGLAGSFLYDPKSRHAQAIRTARTHILLSKMAVAHKLMLVTSALNGEGKTTFITNLAFAMAQTKRTLLIDCDLRNPRIGYRLGLPEGAKGITELVYGSADLKDCVHAVPGSNLLVMPTGELPEHAEEFLLSAPFRDALRSLAHRVDLVLIDTPPVSTCSDALIIAQEANDTLYVVKARETPHPMAQKGLEQLQRAGASILGLVLTNIDTPSRRKPRRDSGTTGYADSTQQGDSTLFGT